LSLFFFTAIVEFQAVLSGTLEKLDVADLRANTDYIGGYHSSHKVDSSLILLLPPYKCALVCHGSRPIDSNAIQYDLL
jgi:hypothetical protein